MTEFPDYLIETAVAGLAEVPEAERTDVYVASL